MHEPRSRNHRIVRTVSKFAANLIVYLYRTDDAYECIVTSLTSIGVGERADRAGLPGALEPVSEVQARGLHGERAAAVAGHGHDDDGRRARQRQAHARLTRRVPAAGHGHLGTQSYLLFSHISKQYLESLSSWHAKTKH